MDLGKSLSVLLELSDSEGLPSREIARGFCSSWESKCSSVQLFATTRRLAFAGLRNGDNLEGITSGWLWLGVSDDLTSWPDFLWTRRFSRSFENSRKKADLALWAGISERRDILGCKRWGEKWWVISWRRCKGCLSRLWMTFYEDTSTIGIMTEANEAMVSRLSQSQ